MTPLDASVTEPPAPWRALGTAWPRCGVGVALGLLATGLLAASWGPGRTFHAVLALQFGLVGMPLFMTAALAAVAAAVSALLLPCGLAALLLGRHLGGRAVLRDAWRLPLGLLPAYLRALRRVRQPLLWGLCCGVLLGGAALGIAPFEA